MASICQASQHQNVQLSLALSSVNLQKVACKDIAGFTFMKSCYLESLKDKHYREEISSWPLRI